MQGSLCSDGPLAKGTGSLLYPDQACSCPGATVKACLGPRKSLRAPSGWSTPTHVEEWSSPAQRICRGGWESEPVKGLSSGSLKDPVLTAGYLSS